MTIRIEGTLRRGELGLDLDVEIEAGRTTIVGTNGTGKTTLLRLVAGLEALEEGTVHINGRLVDDGGSNFVAAHERPTALVFQEHRLFPHLRAIDNVAFPLRRNGVHRVDAHERSLAMLDRVGMHELADRRPQQLSNGQRQRVAIARALVADADVLLLDEPLASIDDTGRLAIRKLLLEATSPTVLWVSHDPADTLDATTVMTFAEGRVGQTSQP